MDSNWTTHDDEILRLLADRYPKNWGLIADTFNTMRAAISTERRSDWECKERYKFKFRQRAEDQGSAPDLQPIASSSSGSVRPQVTTRKRLASMTASVPSPATGQSGMESRKRRRHLCMFDALRKATKKRENAAKLNGNLPIQNGGLSDFNMIT
jgi:chromatin modification-related protein VID21